VPARGDLGAYQGGSSSRQGSWEMARHARRRRCRRRARKTQAARFAANVLPIIRDIQAAGHISLNAIAGQLNAWKVATANGGRWRHVQVRHILDRASAGERGPRSSCVAFCSAL
jgi:Recombinase